MVNELGEAEEIASELRRKGYPAVVREVMSADGEADADEIGPLLISDTTAPDASRSEV
jgi:hypothetical protein